MSSNKKVKEALIRKYGNKCFIERLHIRDTKGMKYKSCGQYKRMKQLTYHHILMKKDGGRATIENGALLSTENHEWFHKQSESDQKIMNNMFQELKREIDNQELEVERVEELDCPLRIACLEVITRENGTLEFDVPKVDKKELKRRQQRKADKQWQRERKDLEDR